MALWRSVHATLLLVGTIVGVGMFGIPFVFQRSGFLLGLLELAVLTGAVVLVHLAYAEVVLLTPGIHRLPGYAAFYFGPIAGWLSRLSYLFGLSGTLLAYVVLGGAFLGALAHGLAPPVPAALGPVLFYLIGVLVILGNLRTESLAEALLTFGLLAGVLVLAVSLSPRLPALLLPAFRLEHLTGPYGVILFALSGAAIIPEIRRLLLPSELRRLGTIVAVGTIIPAVLYALFAAAVLGATGEATTPDAITGLGERFGPAYLLFGSAIGFLAAITSFIGLGVVLEGMFVSDFRIRPLLATGLTALIPAALYLAGFQDFIAIVSVVGALALGFDGILTLFIHREAALRSNAKSFLHISVPPAVRVLLVLMFALGMVAALSRFSWF